jgi:hypothetical protein
MRRYRITPVWFLWLPLFLCGCQSWPLSSKWAMDDLDYAEKYSQPYGDDKPLRMLKQSVDARHLAGKGGRWIGGAGGHSPNTGGAEFGYFFYPSAWTEVGLGLTGLIGTGAKDWFVGPQASLRIQSPTRIAPFAGVGAFAGFNRHGVSADNDGLDNDDDGSIDELWEKRSDYNAFAGVYPEVGVHLWTNGARRITANARYYITEDGRDTDFWFFGISFGWVNEDSNGVDDRMWMPDTEELESTAPQHGEPLKLTTPPIVDEQGWVKGRQTST